jgi:hypothetical protein
VLYFMHFVEQSTRTMVNFALTKDGEKVTPQGSKAWLNHLQNEEMI